jgi:putative oxidoreductase
METSDMDRKSSVLMLLARVGLGLIFLVSALGKFGDWRVTVAYAGAKGVPPVLLACAATLEIAGAASLLLGWKTKLGVMALLVFLVSVTVVFHGFWAFHGADVRLQSTQFLKNLSIGGGLLAILASGPGGISVDARHA